MRALLDNAGIGDCHRAFLDFAIGKLRPERQRDRRPASADRCSSWSYFTFFSQRMDFAWAKADLAFAYRQYARLMDHWRAVLPRERFIEVDYEDLIADREAVTRRLVAFSGLDWHDASLAPSATSERSGPRAYGRRASRSIRLQSPAGGVMNLGLANCANCCRRRKISDERLWCCGVLPSGSGSLSLSP
jgi:hypothetical protein